MTWEIAKKPKNPWHFHTTVWTTPFKSQPSLVYMGVSKAPDWGPVWEVHIWETDASHVLFLVLLLGPFNPLFLLELAPFCDESSAWAAWEQCMPLCEDYSSYSAAGRLLCSSPAWNDLHVTRHGPKSISHMDSYWKRSSCSIQSKNKYRTAAELYYKMISVYKDVRCVRISFKSAQSKLLQLDKDPGHMGLKLQLTVGETMK